METGKHCQFCQTIWDKIHQNILSNSAFSKSILGSALKFSLYRRRRGDHSYVFFYTVEDVRFTKPKDPQGLAR